jgi:hypothetical protein
MSLLGDIKDAGSAVFEVGKAAKGLISNADKLAGGLRGFGNLLQRFSTVGRLGDIARLGRKLAEYGDDALRFLANPEIKRFLKRAKTPILFGGQMTIAGMRLTTGFGTPDAGERFAEGADRFRRACDTLAGAYPNGSWTGSGSESYSNGNSRQLDRAQAMATQDQSINAVLAREAGQITATRAVLDEQSDWLADVGLVTMLVAATPFVGQGASLAMEIAAVTKALGTCTIQLTELTQQVNGNAAEIQQTAGRYGEVSDRSDMRQQPPDSTGPTSPPGGERGDNGEVPGEKGAPTDESDPDSGQAGTGEPTRDGAGAGSGSSGGSGSGSCGAPETPDTPQTNTPTPPATTPPATIGSPAPGGGGLGSLASPVSSLPAAAAGAMPAAGAAGMSAAQIASLVQSAVQKAMQDQAEREEAEKATKDTDGDGILDIEEDENGDGVRDVEQAAAAPGGQEGGRAPVHLAVDVDRAPMTSPIAATLDRNDPIGSPSPPQQ